VIDYVTKFWLRHAVPALALDALPEDCNEKQLHERAEIVGLDVLVQAETRIERAIATERLYQLLGIVPSSPEERDRIVGLTVEDRSRLDHE